MNDKIKILEDKIATIENELYNRIKMLENVNKDTIHCRKIVISPEDGDIPLIVNSPNGSKSMAIEIGKKSKKVSGLVFYEGENEVSMFGVCEHGGGRLQLNNIEGEPMAYIGGNTESDNHEPMIDIKRKDNDLSGWRVLMNHEYEYEGFYDDTGFEW